jgi:hypothetical protein
LPEPLLDVGFWQSWPQFRRTTNSKLSEKRISEQQQTEDEQLLLFVSLQKTEEKSSKFIDEAHFLNVRSDTGISGMQSKTKKSCKTLICAQGAMWHRLCIKHRAILLWQNLESQTWSRKDDIPVRWRTTESKIQEACCEILCLLAAHRMQAMSRIMTMLQGKLRPFW